MNPQNTQEALPPKSLWLTLIVFAILTVGVFVYAFVRIYSLNERIASLSEDLASTTAVLYGTTDTLSKNLSDLNSQAVGISQTLTSTKQDVATANNNISAVKTQVGGVEQAVGSISGTVSTLQKLAAIDSELLKKYSKVYFLNENYTPAHLTLIPQGNVYSNTQQELFLAEAQSFLLKLLAAAKADGVTLYVKSSYRSFGRQQALKAEYTIIYGAGTANSFSADQGYSEHQLGTAVDFVTSGLGGELTNSFDGTAAFEWLTKNAYKFGFEISYGVNNTYYVYEPWHWRFVGVKLATYLHDQNINFYDMDQRDIDTYLANLFD
ncbi:MAG: M15 family metallopeptidase [bacterium]|nr:M15 family metallopeptidase [bacterium]